MIDRDDAAHHSQALRNLWSRWPFESIDEGLDAIAEEFAMPFCPRDELRQHLEHYKPGSSEGKTAAELMEIARDLGAPGSVHTAGCLIAFVLDALPTDGLDNKMLAAAVRAHWQGGKVGFAFLPDPAGEDTDEYEYADQAGELAALLSGDLGLDHWEPRDLIANSEFEQDLDFYDSLPDRLLVYRGVPGVDPELVALGLSWTTEREIAEWFATRGPEPHSVVRAKIRKVDIATVFDSECEVVVNPLKWRAIKCRRRLKGWPPELKWSKR